MSEYIRYIKHPEKVLKNHMGSLDIELTERCNNNCIHCCINLPVDDWVAKEHEMSTGQIKAILQEAADIGCFQVRFTGGEPLLREDFEDLYLFARRLGLKVLIFTNARLITPHLADLLAHIPPRVPIEVTVYGMHAESYEAVSRVKESFAQFWRGVNLLLERQVPFVVKSVLLPPNKQEINEFEAWAATIPWMDRPPSYSMFFDLRNRRDDPKKNHLINSLRLTPEQGVSILTRDAKAYQKTSQEFACKFMGSSGDNLFTCGAGHGMCIDAYGRAQACLGLRAPELTVNVLNDSNHPLATALECFAHLRELKATNPEYQRRCAACFLKGFCEQCPAKSWTEHGNLDTPVEYFCQLAHAQARWLGWLSPDEFAWEPEPRRKFAFLKNSFCNQNLQDLEQSS